MPMTVGLLISIVLLRRSHAVDDVDAGPWPRALDAPVWLTFIAWAITLVFQVYRGYRRLRGLPVVEDPEEKPEGTGH